MQSRQKRSSVESDLPSIQYELDDGSANVELLLTENGYIRIPRTDVCGEHVVDIQDPIQLTVFMHNGGKWATLSQSDVAKMWSLASLTHRSFCTILAQNTFNLTSRQYKTFDRALNDPDTSDVIGIYKNAEDNYALVVRVPIHYRNEKLAAALSGGVFGAAMSTASVIALKKIAAEAMKGQSEDVQALMRQYPIF